MVELRRRTMGLVASLLLGASVQADTMPAIGQAARPSPRLQLSSTRTSVRNSANPSTDNSAKPSQPLAVEMDPMHKSKSPSQEILIPILTTTADSSASREISALVMNVTKQSFISWANRLTNKIMKMMIKRCFDIEPSEPFFN